ncbi:MAG: hypothetical protein ABI199_03490 [Bacteroidia bacterium]
MKKPIGFSKKIFFILAICFAGMFIGKAASIIANSNTLLLSGKHVELIIGVSNISSKTFTAVKTNLSAVSGVIVNAYCPKQKCFFLSVDRSIQHDNSAIITAITNVNSGLKVFIKTGNAADVESHCTNMIYYQQGTNPAPPNKN